MDKNAIKKYAIWARNELIAKVSQKAASYGIEKDNIVDANADSIDGVMLSSVEKKQRKALIEQIKEKGYEQVIEEVAYTWFNRFTAIRFMEVNGYLPSHIRVFTDDDNNFKPQILTEAIHLNDVFEKINMEKVLDLKQEDKTEELYKYLLIIQCNSLNAILPRMFQKIEDYSELLLPDYLLREGSVLEQLVTLIPEEDWQDQVQIIGWLYQYYNSEPKDAVFAALKKNVKITKENIPAATQLFTPDWIVRYMVENSLGRLWLEGHPNDELKSEWKYYLDEAEQEEEVQKQLYEIRNEYAQLKPEDIKCIDPCMGSGHILCYMFDVLVKIYEDYGYTARDAASSIVEKNLWGLDIDERATQLSYFAVMMKARQYDRRFLTRGLQPHVYAIEESNGITSAPMHDMGINLSENEYSQAVKEAKRLVEEMHDAKEYGSIIDVSPCDWNLLRKFAVPRQSEDGQIKLDIHGEVETSKRLQRLINIGQALSQQYHAVVTNPPYMGAGGMGLKLSKYVKDYYPDSKSDLFSCFIEKTLKIANSSAFVSLITMESWMFLSSFEKLRKRLIDEKTITNMVHMPYLGKGGTSLGINFGTSAVVFRNYYVENYNTQYDYVVYYETDSEGVPLTFPVKNERWKCSKQYNYKKISGCPVAYWASDDFIDTFNANKLEAFASTNNGFTTGDNNRFLRLWFEVSVDKICFNNPSFESLNKYSKWFPYNKGGDYRKWYGNNDYVLNWGDNGSEIKGYGHLVPRSMKYQFKESVTWNKITSGTTAFRYKPVGTMFDVGGLSMFPNDNKNLYYLLALCNSIYTKKVLEMISPTLNCETGHVSAIPVMFDEFKETIIELSKENVDLVKADWDSYETSWDFAKHPLIKNTDLIEKAFCLWEKECNYRFERLKDNEERINQLFINMYGLTKELDNKVEDEYISIKKADLKREIKSLISYSVGCMFGRYSLDYDGIAFAGGNLDLTKYLSYSIDKDAIIPVCDDEYFDDDVVNRFISFIEIVYGKQTLEENLLYISSALGGKGSPREIIRNYFLNDFYNDHCSVYSVTGSGKRPIYWLFDSGKKNGFKCLVYMHRYRQDTIARIRTDYVHEQQARYRTAIIDMENRINNSSTSERVKLIKKLNTLKAQDEELRVYEEKIHHLADQMIEIDLDDGVKVNYSKFQDVLAKI